MLFNLRPKRNTNAVRSDIFDRFYCNTASFRREDLRYFKLGCFCVLFCKTTANANKLVLLFKLFTCKLYSFDRAVFSKCWVVAQWWAAKILRGSPQTDITDHMTRKVLLHPFTIGNGQVKGQRPGDQWSQRCSFVGTWSVGAFKAHSLVPVTTDSPWNYVHFLAVFSLL